MLNNCPLCGSSSTKTKYALKSYNIKKCDSCSIMYNADFPLKENRSATFSDDYYNNVQSMAFKPEFINNEKDPSFQFFSDILSKLEQHFEKDNYNLLEVGFGKGVFLKTAIDRGWQVEGVEISEDAHKFVNENITDNVKLGDFKETYQDEIKFNVITFFDSIEHIDQPALYLEKAYNVLNRNGIVVLTTDRYDSVVGYLSLLLYKLTFGLWKYPVRRVFIPYNSFYYTKNSIEKLVEDSGLCILETRKIDYPIDKINLNFVERGILSIIYLLGKLFGLQSQVLIFALKQ